MISNTNPWIITPEERIKFESQFRELNPLNGFVSGTQAKNLFIKSNLPTQILGKIWSLADYDNDGQMTANEFCIAMHLIKRKLEGLEVPDILPATMKNIPLNSTNLSEFKPITNYNTMPSFPMNNNVTAMSTVTSSQIMPSYSTNTSSPHHQNGLNSQTMTKEEDWSMSQAVRPRYRLQFNQQDRNKRGFLTGVEAKAILVQSGLQHQILADIWQLADIDHDGNLTCDEFCIAMHLVEQARAGKTLPSSLPSTLLPVSYQRKPSLPTLHPSAHMSATLSQPKLSSNDILNNNGPITNAQIEEQKKQVLTGEDERRANYLRGQEELQKRRAILEEQMRQEEENRKAKDRAEFEKQEKIRIEKEQARMAEVQRQMEMRRQQELEREEQMRRLAEEREKVRLENEKSRLVEMEKRRLEVATTERRQEQETLSEVNSRKGNLIEALANETEKKRELKQKLENSRETVESYKSNIGSMRERRDRLLESTDSLREELEAARAELNRCQREKQNLELQLQTGGVGGNNVASDPVLEQIKTVQALKSSHQDKIKQLDKEIKDLEQTMTKRGHKLATNRNKVKDLEKKVTSRLVADIKRLQTSVCEKKNAAFAILKNKNKDKSMSFDENNQSQSDRFSAFKRIQGSNSLTNENLIQADREFIYYEALYQFDGRQNDELSFTAGEIIVIDTRDQIEPNSGWLYGWVENTNRCGLFPEVYVNLLRAEPYIQSSRSSIISTNETSNGWTMPPMESTNRSITPTGHSNTIPSSVISAQNTNTWSPFTNNEPISNSNIDVFNNNTVNSAITKSYSNSSSINAQDKPQYLCLCVAMYPYDASVMGDLSVQPGDIIEIHEQKQDWWKGFNRSNQQQGLFPSNYVKVVATEDVAVSESQKMANVQQGFVSTSDIFDVTNNDMVTSQMSINSLSSSTYSSIGDGVNSVNNTLESPNHQQLHSSDQSIGSVTPEIAQVVIDFKATSAEQLSLQVGQIIQVRDKSTSGWWKGEIQNDETDFEDEQRGQQRRIGWFPGKYVNIMNPSQSIHASELSTSNVAAASHTPPSCTTPTPMDPSSSNTNFPTTTSTQQQFQTSNTELADSLPGDYLITMYNYAAQNVDELTFDKNSVIVLLDKNEPEWWMGRNLLTSQEGLFPVNYIRRMQADNPQDEEAMRIVIQTNGVNSLGTNATVAGRPVSWYIDGTMSFNAILTEDEKRRQFYIRELIETEKVYYDDLQEVHQIFYEPIKRSNMLTQDELKSIFINWSDLIPNSYNFYMALKIRKDIAGSQQPIQCIGDILLSNFPNFIVYVRFCSLQNQAIAKLQKKQQQNTKFKDLCEQCETNLRCQKMPMTSYFLKPMQRITKYKLLVENILKHTEENHPDRSDIEEAVAAARSLCESVNEGVRERENSERLEWLQEHVQCDGLSGEKLYFNSHTNCLGHRKLLHSGTLYKSRSNKELVGFLCNDFLLLAVPQYNTGNSPFVFPLETSSRDKMQFKMYKKPIILNQVMISIGNPTSTSSGHSNNELFTVKEPNYEYVLKALSPNDRDKWVEKLMNASTFYINTENSKRERSMSIRRTAGVGRLIVTVMEANNLRPGNRKDSKADPFCEVSLGNQLHRTKVVPSTLNPKWNTQMQFLIKNIDRDSLCLTVYNKDYFAPNDFLGRIEVSVCSVVNEKRTHREPIEKRLKLMEVDSGELTVRLDLALFKKIN